MENSVKKSILSILERDARTKTAQIAAMLDIPEAEAAAAIAQLEAEGVIRRHKTIVDWERFGDERVYAFIDVRVSPAREVGYDDVAERIYRFPQVHAVYLVSGGQDLRVLISGKTMKEVASFVSERLAPIDRIEACNTQFILKRYKEDDEIFGETESDNRLVVSP